MYRRRRLPALAGFTVLVCLALAPVIGPRGDAPRKLPKRAGVGAYILGPLSLVAGSLASYRVAVHWASAPGKTGPLPGARVNLALKQKKSNVPLAASVSDVTGNARFRFAVPRLRAGEYRLTATVRSRLGNQSYATQIRIQPGGRVLLTTDKSLYQPSQTIHARALVLGSMNRKPVSGRPVVLRVADPKGNVVFLKKTTTSRFGVASLDFRLADEINLGPYSVTARLQGDEEEAQKTVKVERYVLPRYKVSVETDLPYYQPGNTIKGTVRCGYFFGKPVVGARVSLRAIVRGGTVLSIGPSALRTDARGRFHFQVPLPTSLSNRTNSEVRLQARVTDTAGQRERADASLELTAEPLRLAMLAEADRLVPGVVNRVFVMAGYPDGKPARGAVVTLRASWGATTARTDALGLATFSVRPQKSRKKWRCENSDDDGGAGVLLRVGARDRLGNRSRGRRCLTLAPRGAMLARPARAISTPGQPLKVTLLGPASHNRRVVHLDLLKGGQTLLSLSRHQSRGRASFTVKPDAHLSGLLELRGYSLSRAGQRRGTSRMIYVDPPQGLRVQITADRKEYRPGQRARVRFQVSHNRTGKGVQAALGVVAVDEAALALSANPLDDPRLFFNLAGLARETDDPEVLPGGRDLHGWIMAPHKKPADAGQRARAAEALLAALRPLTPTVWETNPWARRRDAWQQQAPELIAAARAFARTHSVGQRTARGWRFHAELMPRLAAAGAIKKSASRDPWQRVVRPWHLRKEDPTFVFAPLAAKQAPRRLERLYDVLDDHKGQLGLRRERAPGLARVMGPLVFPRDLPARLVRLGKLKAHEIVDPWGKPFRVVKNPNRLLVPYEHCCLLSRYVIVSAGPDGVIGTRDDVRPKSITWKISTGPGGRLNHAAARQLRRVPNELCSKHCISCCCDGWKTCCGCGYGGGYGAGGLGTIGYGSGMGALRGRTARMPHVTSMPARVRSHFPETLVWRPQLITDPGGKASLDLEMADSITTWKLNATASSARGLLGVSSTRIKVFQPFFVEMDLPSTLTQGDRISLPVTVYNYQKTAQTVDLRLGPEPWFSATVGSLRRQVVLGPSQVKVVHFTLQARRVGPHDLTVHASAAGSAGATVTDAVRRSTTVAPDGVEHSVSHSGHLRTAGRTPVRHIMELPATAVPGTRKVAVTLYPGAMSQTMDGLDGMLRMPSGCFEQTSSTTYPNVLILDYLKRSRRLTAAVELRARRFINLGYQRLISFEVQGGGFSWFGSAPANKILTAYGLMEFHDMARVHPVDPRLIKRTRRWLAGKQRKDGSWAPDGQTINEGATNKYNSDLVRITAYIAHALERAGYRGPALSRARAYVRKHASRAKDPYTLALLGNLLAKRPADGLGRQVFARLWQARVRTARGIGFTAPASTLTHGAGRSAEIETTALAALALLQRGAPARKVRPLLDTLVANKDSMGSWHSTQATILTLRAMILQQERFRSIVQGRVEVLVDGKVRHAVQIKPHRLTAHRLDLTGFAGRGRHRVGLRFVGKGDLQYHLTGRYWLPRLAGARPRKPSGPLSIRTSLKLREVRTGQQTRLLVDVHNNGKTAVNMPLVDLALPPAFSVEEEDLTWLVTHKRVDKLQRIGDRALLYLTRLGPGQRLAIPVRLRARFPARVQVRPSVVYEYYRPENRAQSRPMMLRVK